MSQILIYKMSAIKDDGTEVDCRFAADSSCLEYYSKEARNRLTARYGNSIKNSDFLVLPLATN
jgi:hypothetical protein